MQRLIRRCSRPLTHTPVFVPLLCMQIHSRSKVNPFPTYGESLTPESVRAQWALTSAALGVSSVDILYLHAPDITTPIEDTLEGAC